MRKGFKFFPVAVLGVLSLIIISFQNCAKIEAIQGSFETNTNPTTESDDIGKTEAPVLSASYLMGTADDEQPFNLVQVSDGGFISGGHVTVDPADPTTRDVQFTKWTETGELVYARRISSIRHDQVFSVLELADSYLLAGITFDRTDEAVAQGGNILVVKLNKSDGSILAQSKLTSLGNTDERVFAMQSYTDSEGNDSLILIGDFLDTGLTENDALVVKLDLDFNVIWQKSLRDDAGTSFFPQTVRHVEGQGIYVAGFHVTVDQGNNAFVMKLDEDGNLIAAKSYGGLGTDRIASIANTSDQLFLVGRLGGEGFGQSDAMLIRSDFDLNFSSVVVTGGQNFDEFTGVVLRADSIVFAGNTSSVGVGLVDNFVMKVNTDGVVEYVTSIGGLGDDTSFFGSLAARAGGGVAIISGQNEDSISNGDFSSRNSRLTLVDQYGDVRESCSGVRTGIEFEFAAVEDLAPVDLSLTSTDLDLQVEVTDLTVGNLDPVSGEICDGAI